MFLATDIRSQAHLIMGERIFDVPTNNSSPGNMQNRLLPPDNNAARSMMPGTILYDQSELINQPGAGAVGADVSATTGQLFGVLANISSNFILADDFVVPPGELWVIDSIIIFHYQTNSTTSSTITDVRMQIRQGVTPGAGTIVFGDLTTNRLSNTYFSGIYRTLPSALMNTQRPIMRSVVNTSSLSLGTGSYMMEHLVGGSLASGPLSPLRTIGTTHISTGDGYQFNGMWNNILELDAVGNNPLPKGITFMVYGTSCTPPSATFTSSASFCTGITENNNGTITLVSQNNTTHFGVSSAGAAIYNGPLTIGAANAIPANGMTVVTGVQHAGTSYILRVFNGEDVCFTDIEVTVPPGPSCVLNGTFDLALNKSTSNLPIPTVQGSLVTYTLTVANEGDYAATNVGLNDYFPSGLTLSDPDWTAAGNTASLNTPIALLPAMSQTSVDITFLVNNLASGSIVNNAEILQASGGVDEDSTPGNGTAASNEDDLGSAAIDICQLPILVAQNDTVCRGTSVDLSSLIVLNTGDDLKYYTSITDALSNTNALISPSVIVNSAKNYYIKSSYSPFLNGCQTIIEVTLYTKAARCATITVTGP